VLACQRPTQHWPNEATAPAGVPPCRHLLNHTPCLTHTTAKHRPHQAPWRLHTTHHTGLNRRPGGPPDAVLNEHKPPRHPGSRQPGLHAACCFGAARPRRPADEAGWAGAAHTHQASAPAARGTDKGQRDWRVGPPTMNGCWDKRASPTDPALWAPPRRCTQLIRVRNKMPNGCKPVLSASRGARWAAAGVEVDVLIGKGRLGAQHAWVSVAGL